ncbi:unnamed protein product, partial [Heterotrigona itama]
MDTIGFETTCSAGISVKCTCSERPTDRERPRPSVAKFGQPKTDLSCRSRGWEGTRELVLYIRASGTGLTSNSTEVLV